MDTYVETPARVARLRDARHDRGRGRTCDPRVRFDRSGPLGDRLRRGPARSKTVEGARDSRLSRQRRRPRASRRTSRCRTQTNAPSKTLTTSSVVCTSESVARSSLHHDSSTKSTAETTQLHNCDTPPPINHSEASGSSRNPQYRLAPGAGPTPDPCEDL